MKKVKSLHCKGLCQASCGPIFFRGNERAKAKQYCTERGLEFHELSQDRVYILLSLYTATDAKDIIAPCPYLNDGKCSIYLVRPLICKLWGVVEGMRCPFGCVPEEGYLTDREAMDMMNSLE